MISRNFLFATLLINDRVIFWSWANLANICNLDPSKVQCYKVQHYFY